ncbi:MAG: phosphate ABC transporter permease PstA [Gammaproteobacteria bacterium]|nr:phosphate ABC transporter permease PstA [Gammaproteobacteria bacterium]
MTDISKWFKSGQPWIWLNAAAVSTSLIMVFGLVVLIATRGLGFFWPADVMKADYQITSESSVFLIGEIVETEDIAIQRVRDGGYEIDSNDEFIQRHLIKTGNRDIYGSDFQLVFKPLLTNVQFPEEIIAIERREWGNFYGYLKSVKKKGEIIAEGEEAKNVLPDLIDRVSDIFAELRVIQQQDIGAINYSMEKLRLKKRRLELDNDQDPGKKAKIASQRETLDQKYSVLQKKMTDLQEQIQRDSIVVEAMNGEQLEVSLQNIVHAYYPNSMSVLGKTGFYFAKIWEFVSDEPREANTEGGIFPAIFGTVMMVMLMAVLVTPFGVVAAVYLREYAKQGPIVRVIRIAVNNLAGVPSIVYGVFGLGFFVYFLGGNIDALFFPEAAPAPVFGTPGILWSSLTLALLTLPVVIVATEEGLSRIPSSIREGSLALGATKAETLWRTILPMASPAMMTGLILAVARAAGEVAPLMLVGVVKLAPSLPLDGNFPFLHMERKFMHLGFHIYDVGFQSPNVEAARPLVYATSLLLIVVIVLLNLLAITIRNRLRERYKALES